ncbi:MAG: hypothetical protein L6R43_06020 [Planctomycetes bacterium]|nr:hypothetical protein [Planctomycetota bacterium]
MAAHFAASTLSVKVPFAPFPSASASTPKARASPGSTARRTTSAGDGSRRSPPIQAAQSTAAKSKSCPSSRNSISRASPFPHPSSRSKARRSPASSSGSSRAPWRSRIGSRRRFSRKRALFSPAALESRGPPIIGAIPAKRSGRRSARSQRRCPPALIPVPRIRFSSTFHRRRAQRSAESTRSRSAAE